MPTQKFLNLNIHKQRIILAAMRDEFLMGPFAEITVSRLANEAGISRASFYTYFDGKEDVFSCMLRAMAGEVREMLEGSFRKNRGVFCDSMAQVFLLLIENNAGRTYSMIYKHILDDEGCRPAFTQIEQEYYRKETWRERGIACFRVLDRSLYPDLDEDGLSCALDMGMTILCKAVALYFDQCVGLKELEKSVRMQLNILEQGIRAQSPGRKDEK